MNDTAVSDATADATADAPVDAPTVDATADAGDDAGDADLCGTCLPGTVCCTIPNAAFYGKCYAKACLSCCQ